MCESIFSSSCCCQGYVHKVLQIIHIWTKIQLISNLNPEITWKFRKNVLRPLVSFLIHCTTGRHLANVCRHFNFLRSAANSVRNSPVSIKFWSILARVLSRIEVVTCQQTAVRQTSRQTGRQTDNRQTINRYTKNCHSMRSVGLTLAASASTTSKSPLSCKLCFSSRKVSAALAH